MSDDELDELESDFDAQDVALGDGAGEEARSVIAAGKDSADRLIAASRELESIVYGVVQDETNSLAGTELDISDAKTFLSVHKLYKARRSVRRAEKALGELEEDVLYLRILGKL